MVLGIFVFVLAGMGALEALKPVREYALVSANRALDFFSVRQDAQGSNTAVNPAAPPSSTGTISRSDPPVQADSGLLEAPPRIETAQAPDATTGPSGSIARALVTPGQSNLSGLGSADYGFTIAPFDPPVAAARISGPQLSTSDAVPLPKTPQQVAGSQRPYPSVISSGPEPRFDIELPSRTQLPNGPGSAQSLAAAAPESSPIITVEPPAPSTADPAAEIFQSLNLVLHTPETITRAELDSVLLALRINGFPVGEPNRVNFTISRTNVRYFHLADEPAARALADAIGALLRDFTDYRPQPSEGTVEIWVAGQASPSPAEQPDPSGEDGIRPGVALDLPGSGPLDGPPDSDGQ